MDPSQEMENVLLDDAVPSTSREASAQFCAEWLVHTSTCAVSDCGQRVFFKKKSPKRRKGRWRSILSTDIDNKSIISPRFVSNLLRVLVLLSKDRSKCLLQITKKADQNWPNMSNLMAKITISGIDMPITFFLVCQF